MKKFAFPTLLIGLLSTHLSAMEQRWQADLSNGERERNLPKFPFSSVLEHRSPLDGLTMQGSVVETARHIIRYANTAHSTERSRFLTGYLKLAYINTAEILTRATYKDSENPMERLLQDLEAFHTAILSSEQTPQRTKSHSSIWLARFLMKMESQKDPHPLQQEAYLKAYTLLGKAHDQHTTDVSLLLMAKLLVQHKLRIQWDTNGEVQEITDYDARNIARQVLDNIQSRPKPVQHHLGALQAHPLHPVQPQIVPVAPTEAEEVLPFQSVRMSYLNSREHKALYTTLLRELHDQQEIPQDIQPQLEAPEEVHPQTIEPIDAMDIDVGASSASDPQTDHHMYTGKGHIQTIVQQIDKMGLIGKTLNKQQWETIAQTLFEQSNTTIGTLRAITFQACQNNFHDESYRSVFRMLTNAFQRLEKRQLENRSSMLTPMEKDVLAAIDSLNISGEYSKQEWEDIARKLLIDTKPYAMEARLLRLKGHLTLSEDQKANCHQLAKACQRIATRRLRSVQSESKRKRDADSGDEESAEQPKSKRQRTDDKD